MRHLPVSIFALFCVLLLSGCLTGCASDGVKLPTREQVAAAIHEAEVLYCRQPVEKRTEWREAWNAKHPKLVMPAKVCPGDAQ